MSAIDLSGRKLSMEGGRAFAELIEDIRQTVEDCETSSNPALPDLAARLGPAAEALEEAVQFMASTDVEDRLAGSTAFLKLTGDVTGGWLLCVGAVAAQRRLKESDGDARFAENRIALAGIYADTVLAAAPGLLGEIRLGASPLFEPGLAMLESA